MRNIHNVDGWIPLWTKNMIG